MRILPTRSLPERESPFSRRLAPLSSGEPVNPEFGVEQSAMNVRHSANIGRRRVVAAGVLAPRQHEGVNEALGRNRRLGRALQLGIEKGDVKTGVVRDQRRISVPISETMIWALRFLIPGTVMTSSTAVRKGPRMLSTCASTVATAASRASIGAVLAHNDSLVPRPETCRGRANTAAISASPRSLTLSQAARKLALLSTAVEPIALCCGRARQERLCRECGCA